MGNITQSNPIPSAGINVVTTTASTSPLQVAKSVVPAASQQPTLCTPGQTSLLTSPNNKPCMTANAQFAGALTSGSTAQPSGSSLFSNVLSSSTVDLSKCIDESKNLELQRKSFINQIKEIENNALSPIEKEQLKTYEEMSMFEDAAKIANVRVSNEIRDLTHFIFEEARGPERFNSNELTILFNKLHDLGAFTEMSVLYERSNNHAFKDSAVNKELLATAYMHEFHPNVAMMVIEQAVLKDGANPELLALKAKAYEMQYEAADDFLQNPNNKKAQELYQNCFGDGSFDIKSVAINRDIAREKCAKIYESAFFLDYDPIHGMLAVEQYIKIDKFEEASKLTHLVELACLRDGGMESTSFEILSTLLNVSCLLGKDEKTIQSLCDRIQLAIDAPWKIRQNIENLNTLIEALERSHKPVPKAVTDSLEFMEIRANEIERGKTAPDNIKEIRSRIAGDQAAATPMAQKWKSKSFSYRGLTSNFIEGNFKFGGQLFDHSLNRADRKNFEALLQSPLGQIVDFNKLTKEESAKITPEMNLNDIDDPSVFCDVVDLFVRQSFRTKEQNLENLHSPEHQEYDKLAKNLILLSGAPDLDKASLKQVDSRTNISTILTIGLGDCRHHAQSKQLLFDMWQRNHANELLGEAVSALESNDNEKFEQTKSQISDITRTELRTFDVVVQAPVQMTGIYNPINHADGEHLEQLDGTLNKIEEHTLNILLHFDEKGEVDSARTADSFYQEHYQWKNHELDIHQDITDEATGVQAGTVPAHGADDKLKEVPVSFFATVYAGKRDKYAPANDEQHLMGHTVKYDFINQVRVEFRSKRLKFLQKLETVV